MKRSTLLIGVSLLMAGTIGLARAGVNDGRGKEWMQLPPTVGLSWNATAQVCPQDGASACAGTAAGRNVNDWVWATDAQVLQLFSIFEPAMLTNRSVGGIAYFRTAELFLSAFQPTQSFCITYSCGAYGAGWTASKDEFGAPIFGAVGWGTTPVSVSGSFGVSPAASADEALRERGH